MPGNYRAKNNRRRKHGGGYSHDANGSGVGGGMMTKSGDKTGPSGTGGGNVRSGAGKKGYHACGTGKGGGNRRSRQVGDTYR